MLGSVMLPLRRRWPVRRAVSPAVLLVPEPELEAELVRLPPTGCRRARMLPWTTPWLR
tara:strand:+ start:197 stop:370 length:174 start_codon:yes stop_codon:yes gene_type:complete